MKRTLTIFICSFILVIGTLFLFSQETKTKEERVSQVLNKRIPSYNPAGRRDPFRDLLGGRDVQTPDNAEGIPQMYINDVVLVGIVKSKNQFTAIVNNAQGFPYYITEGAKFADGYVLSVEASRVIFRKTHERGIPLRQPKDVIKEL